MKTRKLYAIIGILAVCAFGVLFIGCPDVSSGGDIDKTPNPAVPVISELEMDTAVYNTINATATPLTVTAAVSDGGTLSYQWYSTKANRNTGGDAISGATESSYTPPTDTKGVVYYYIVVTNTLNNKTASVTGIDVAGIGVAITQVTISSGITVTSKVYDGTTTATFSGTATLSSEASGKDVTVNAGTIGYKNKNVGTGKEVTLTGWYLSGPDADDYMLKVQQDSIKGTITAKPVTITGLAAVGKPYDGNTTATVTGTAIVNGKIAADTVDATGGTAAFDNKNVGTGKVVTFSDYSLTGADAGNYTLSAQPANVTAVITPKPVTVTGLTVSDKVYDGNTTATTAGSATVSGIESGDTVTVTSGTVAFADKNVGTGKAITFTGWTLGGAGAGNYSLSAQPAGITANITAKPVTITGLSAQNKEYNGNATATVTGTAVFSGLISGETITATGGTAAFADKTVGTGKTVTFSGYTLGGAGAGNYSLSAQPVSVTANITAKSVTITGLTAQNKEYNGNTTATVNETAKAVSGKIATDTVNATGGTAAFADKNVGTGKDVTFSGWTLTGADAGNYNLSAQPITVKAAITPKPVSVSGLTASNKEYDGTTAATVSGSAVLGGIVGGDAVTLSGGSLAFADKNVGTAKPITFTGWTLTGTDAGNYSLSAQPSSATANITAKAVTITGLGAQNKVYDGAATATVSGTAVVDGKLAADTVTVTAGTAAFADKNVGTGITVTFSGWTLTGADAGNYNLSAQPANVTANITAKPLTVTGLTAENKVYDGTTAATVSGSPALGGIVGGDTVTLNNGTLAFADKNVGNGKAITFSGWTLGGASAGNYSLSA
jgi:hypothetical protein